MQAIAHKDSRVDRPDEVLFIALAQLRCSDGDTERNTERAVQAIQQAAAQGADLVLFPELYLTGILWESTMAARSEPRDGKYIERIQKASKRHHIGVAMGFVEKADQFHNTTMLTDKTGSPLTFYHKTHLWGGEARTCGAGTTIGDPVVFEGVKLGLLVCYDVEFPEAARHLALRGAQCILVPTANLVPWACQHRAFIIARAMENHLFVAYCNRADCGEHYIHTGDSAIVDPFGRLVRDLGANPTVATTGLDFTVIAGSRRELDYIRDRRPELYTELIAPVVPPQA
jgi:predicted amidohydrolase